MAVPLREPFASDCTFSAGAPPFLTASIFEELRRSGEKNSRRTATWRSLRHSARKDRRVAVGREGFWNIPELKALRARCRQWRRQDWRWTMSDRRHGREARPAGKPDKEKHQEGNLGQKEARLEKEKQSELSHMGESARDASQHRKND